MASNSQYMRVVVQGTAASGTEPQKKRIFNVFDYRRTLTVSPPSKSAFITAFSTAVLTPLAAQLSVSYLQETVSARLLDDPLDPFLILASAINGTSAGDSLPTLNDVVMQMKTGVRLAGSRGSKHFGPIAEGDTLLDAISPAAQITWTAFGVAYLAGFTDSAGSIWQPYLVSSKLSILKGNVAEVMGNLITTIQFNSVLGLMRKRRQPQH